MARLINIEKYTKTKRFGFHLFDQWKKQKYGSWCFSIFTIDFDSYHIQKGITIRFKLLGLCLELFIYYGPVYSEDQEPF